MFEVLQPITQFTSPRDMGDVAARIMSMVNTSDIRKLLQKRHLTGVLERFPQTAKPSKDDITAAARRIQKARERHRQGAVGTYVVMDGKGEIAGLATVIPNLRLKRHRTIMPKHFSLGILQEKISVAGPEITAWTSEPSPSGGNNVANSRLGLAYEALLVPGGPTEQFTGRNNMRPNPWTIEPQRAPSWIHAAIVKSGLNPRSTEARYDDGEPENFWYPYSKLYSAHPIAQLASREA